jgi:hypothetical protein
MKHAPLLGLLVGCAGYGKASQVVDSPTASDAFGNQCNVTLSFSPTPAYAGATVRAAAYVQNNPGNPMFTWHVRLGITDVPFTNAQSDGSQIDFVPTTPGMYDVGVDLGLTSPCDATSTTLNVFMPGAGTADYRFHVVPPLDLAPPQDAIVVIVGGSNQGHDIGLDPGLKPLVQVTDGSAGVAAYVRFQSTTSPTAFIDAFAGIDGYVQPLVLGQPYNVLVVPASGSFAPSLQTWQVGSTQLTVTAGSTATGTVLDPAGAPLAGATVQLTSLGVPSTIATTAANGTFSVQESFTTGDPVIVDVTPPAGRGLPRLTATSAFDLSTALSVHYAAGLGTTCDLSGLAVARGGTNKPGAVVTVVGTIASAGMVNTTAAAGTVHVAATADGTGHLPATKVPKASLTAVTQVAPGDLAVSAFDESTCGAASVSAPANTVATGTISGPTGTLQGAIVEASPTRALALAGAPAVQATTDSAGNFSLPLAAGGFYDVRFSDPLGRAGPATPSLDIAAANVPTATTLVKALVVSGKLTVNGLPNPVVGAAVQVLCATCTGLDQYRPIASGATDMTSRYSLAVPDPM